MSNSAVAPSPTGVLALRKLYLVRFGFAIIWAALILIGGSTLTAFSVTLIVIYPLFDVAAAIVDARTSRSGAATTGLYVNMVISVLAAIGLAIALSSGTSAALLVWGGWAIASGALQLAVGISRRRLGGQWAIIFAGALSIFAGGGFAALSGSSDPKLTALGGYAILGGIFFLISALRMGRAAKRL